jgi:hypothetical protein
MATVLDPLFFPSLGGGEAEGPPDEVEIGVGGFEVDEGVVELIQLLSPDSPTSTTLDDPPL